MLKVCTNCGFTWDEITNAHLVGCHVCYEVFEKEINMAYHVWHGFTDRHQDQKETEEDSQKQDVFARLSQLREQLSKALIQENFEEAGKIKKQLFRLEGSDGLD